MSGFYQKEINFEDMASRAMTVFVVKDSGKPLLKKFIDIGEPDEDYPPFEFCVTTYEVIRIVHDSCFPEVKTGELLEVYPADFDTMLGSHVSSCIMGIGESWMVDCYTPKKLQANDKEFLIFLSRTADSKHWRFYCQDSVEGLDYQDSEIIKALHQSNKKSPSLLKGGNSSSNFDVFDIFKNSTD